MQINFCNAWGKVSTHGIKKNLNTVALILRKEPIAVLC